MATSETPPDYEMADPSATALQPSPLSISLLFYVVTVGAILSACLRTLVGSDSISVRALAVLIVAGVSIGFITGGCLGLFGYKSFQAAGLCALMGIIVGAVAGGLAAVSGNSFNEIALVSFGGCWLLIVIMLISARRRAN